MPPSRLSSAISSSLKVPCSYLVTFHLNPFNKSWKSYFWKFFPQLWKICRRCQQGYYNFWSQNRKNHLFSNFFETNLTFFCLNLNSTWKMHSFNVYIVDIAQKLQNLKFFAIFWSNCTIKVILHFFYCFLQKKFWKWLLWTGNDLSFQETVFLELCDAPELS